MIFGRVIAMAALFSVAGALAGCATGDAVKDRPRVGYYMSEQPAYHRFTHLVLTHQTTPTTSGDGAP